jgi:hypothetical protein
VRAKNARALAVPALASFGNTKTGSGTKRRAKRLDRASVAVRPVKTRSGEQFDLAAVNPGVHPVAVVFDLV